MRALKMLVQNWMPPVLASWLRRFYGGGVRLKGEFNSWAEASNQCTGYDAKEILSKVESASSKVKNGEAAYERDSVLFEEIEYVWPVLAGLMWVAARNGGRLNVLDFGGALGSSYFQNRKFLEVLKEVRWNVIEQPHYTEAGKSRFQDEQLRFYKTLDECLAENIPNVILLSSVMQYLESPFEFFNDFKKMGTVCLIIDRTPFSLNGKDKLVIQQVPSSIYSASYPMWIFSLPKFKQRMEKDWTFIASNISPEGYVQAENGFKFSFQGMMLESNR